LFSLISEIKRIWIRFTCVSLFHYKISLHFFRFFSHFFRFFRFFRFKFFASLRLSNFCFKAKRNSCLFFRFFRFFSRFFAFFAFFHFFSLNFRFALIFSPNFCLFYLRFRFKFLVFRIEVNHVKSSFFFASLRNEIFASISNFASEAKVRAHPRQHCSRSMFSLTWQNLQILRWHIWSVRCSGFVQHQKHTNALYTRYWICYVCENWRINLSYLCTFALNPRNFKISIWN
jgi:hypothetical protein